MKDLGKRKGLKMIKIFFAFILIAALWGCNHNYEMKESGGKLYRLNKKTGVVYVVESKSLIPLPEWTGEDRQALAWAKANPSDPRADKILKKLEDKGLLDRKDSPWLNDPIVNVIDKDTIISFYAYLGGNPSDSNNWKFSGPSFLTDKQMDELTNTHKPWEKYHH